MKNPKTIIFMVAIFFGLYFILSAVFKGMYTIQSGTVGVLVSFGKFSDEVQSAGLHFKIPFIQEVRVVDIKLQTANYIGHEDAQDSDGVSNNPQIEILDNKSLPIGIDITVQYTALPELTNRLLEQYGENYFLKYINPIIRNIVRNVIGKYQAEEIAQQRAEIGKEIEIQLTKEFEGKPFRLENAGLRNINLPPIVLDKIKEVQLAKQEEQRLGMIEQQAKKSQEIKTIEANTKSIEVTTQAKADAEKQRIAADASAYQITAEAKARAEANKLMSQSITRELIDYLSVQQWDGRYPQMLMGSNPQGGLLLSLPNTTTSISPSMVTPPSTLSISPPSR